MKLKLSFLASIFTILLFAQSAPAYYSSINFAKTGNALKTDLATLITNTHTHQISYSAGLKDLFKTSDADPDKPGNILLMYGFSNQSGTYQRSRPYSGSWNREHVYAKSLGTPNLGTSGPGSDGHHLRPADVTFNSQRGNYKFADGSGNAGKSNGGWYPGDEWKGDVARILLYMYVRYNTRCMPGNIAIGPKTYSSDMVDLLLKWNVEDPVSNFERQRNEVVYSVQGNRNPFIDNAYLATVIWGGPAAQNSWPDTFNGGSSDDSEAPSVPTNLTVSGVTSSSVSLTWTASTDNIAVSGYDVYVDNVYKTTVYSNAATITGLSPETTYSFYVVARDASGNKSGSSESVSATTEAGNGDGDGGNGGAGTSCGTEDFENIPSTGGNPPASSYADRTWMNNNIVWTATNARTDKQGYIGGDNDKAICIKHGDLKSSTISGGIGSLSVKTYLPFNDQPGVYTLKINGEVKGEIPYSKTAKTFTIDNINVEGNIVIELVDEAQNINNRVSFDNLSWTCYTAALGVGETEISKISVYPNPVKNNEFFINGIDKNETVQIYNLNGQLVQTVKDAASNKKIVLNHLPKGVYLVKTKTQSTKIIVE